MVPRNAFVFSTQHALPLGLRLGINFDGVFNATIKMQAMQQCIVKPKTVVCLVLLLDVETVIKVLNTLHY